MPKTIKCRRCQKPTPLNHPSKKFCSQRCKDRYHNKRRSGRGRDAHSDECENDGYWDTVYDENDDDEMGMAFTIDDI